MGSSLPAAIDYLVGACRDGVTVPWRNVTVPALSTINANVEIVDGAPKTSDGVWVVIGRDDWDQDAAGTGSAKYAELGAERIEEDYTIPCFVHFYTDGSVQKTARDGAFALFDGVVRLVHADPTLGGLLERGRIGLVSNLSFLQQNTSGGTESVSALVHFELTVQNSYIP